MECNAVGVGFLDEHMVWIEGENGEIGIFSLDDEGNACVQVSCIRFVDKVSRQTIALSGVASLVSKQPNSHSSKSLAVARGNASSGFPVFERITAWEKGVNCLERTSPAFSNIKGPASSASLASQSIENVPVQGKAAEAFELAITEHVI